MKVTVNILLEVTYTITVFYLIAKDELFNNHLFECHGEGGFV